MMKNLNFRGFKIYFSTENNKYNFELGYIKMWGI